MTRNIPGDAHQSQSDKFKALAREVEADPDEKAWDERLKKVAKHKLREFTPEEVAENILGMDDPERQKRRKPAPEKPE